MKLLDSFAESLSSSDSAVARDVYASVFESITVEFESMPNRRKYRVKQGQITYRATPDSVVESLVSEVCNASV